MKADLERGSDSTAAALLDGDGWAPWTTSRQQSMVSKRTEHACVKQARAAASETPGGTAGPTESARAGQPRAYLRVFGVPSLGCEPGVQWQEPLTGGQDSLGELCKTSGPATGPRRWPDAVWPLLSALEISTKTHPF